MAIFIYDCVNEDCDNSKKAFQTKEDIICDVCGSLMEKNKIKSMKKIHVDKVPGGYDQTVLKQQRNTQDGQLSESAVLSNNSNSAY